MAESMGWANGVCALRDLTEGPVVQKLSCHIYLSLLQRCRGSGKRNTAMQSCWHHWFSPPQLHNLGTHSMANIACSALLSEVQNIFQLKCNLIIEVWLHPLAKTRGTETMEVTGGTK